MHRPSRPLSTSGPRARNLLSVLALLALAPPAGAQDPANAPPTPGTWRNLGPDGGVVQKVAAHPTDPNVVFAAGSGGIFRSGDGGATWSPANDGLSLRPQLSTDVSVVDLEFHRAFPQWVYAAIRADGVVRSTDGGATWVHVDGDISNLVSSIAVDPVNGYRVFAATPAGLYRTGNGGASWRLLTRGLPAAGGPHPARAEIVTLDPSNPQTVYAVFQPGAGEARLVYKSSTGGSTWRPIASGALAGRFVSALEVDPLRPATIWAGTRTGLVASADGGATWRPRGLANRWVFSILFHPTRSGTAYAGTQNGVFRTTDGGAHWAPAGSSFGDLPVFSLAFAPGTPRTLYAGTSPVTFGSKTGGVYKTTDAAATWRFSSAGIRALSARHLAIDPADPSKLWLGTDAGLWKSADRGATWRRLPVEARCGPFGPHSVELDPANPETAYVTTSDNSGYSVCATRDGGASWSRLLTSPGRIAVARVDPLQTSTVYAGGLGMWKSADRGVHWTRLPGAPNGYDVAEILIGATAPAPLYFLGFLSHPSFLFDLVRTFDRGATWEILGSPSGASLNPTGLAVDPFDSQRLYAADGGVIRTSTDGGAHWSILTETFLTRSGLVHASKARSGRLHYAARTGLVYGSEDGGATWSRLGVRGPDHVQFESFLADDPADPDRLYVGTRGGALLEFTRRP